MAMESGMRLFNYGLDTEVSFTSKSKIKRIALSSLFMAMLASGVQANTEFEFAPIDDGILKLMGQLESDKDPKCHATATRLEGLIYGTPLSDGARYAKSEHQKQLVKQIWIAASKAFPAQDPLTEQAVVDATSNLFKASLVESDAEAYWQVELDNQQVIITERDQKHYGSIAYTLRAMLAVQQDVLLDFDLELPELSDEAASYITEQVDLVTLSLLKLADERARKADLYEVSTNHIERSWLQLFPKFESADSNKPVTLVAGRSQGYLRS